MITLRGTSWRVCGMTLIPSDSIYKDLVTAINENTLDQEYLQKVTGYRNPIIIDRKNHYIQFC